MTKDHREGSSPEQPPRYEGDAILLPGRVERLERDSEQSKQRDEKYKDEQLKLDRRMVRFTGLLVVVGVLGGGTSIWQASIAQRSANAAKQSADAAKTAADLAGKTLTEAQTTG